MRTVVDMPAGRVFSIVKHRGERFEVALDAHAELLSAEELSTRVVEAANSGRPKPLPESAIKKIWEAAVSVHYTMKEWRTREPAWFARVARPTRDPTAPVELQGLQGVRTVDLEPADFDPASAQDAVERVDRTIKLRRGQPEFREALLDAYGGRCAITACDADAVLEAAHIVNYSGARTNHVQNGILLRADIHTLFDRFLISVDTSDWKVLLQPVLLGSTYKAIAGQPFLLPKQKALRPSAAALNDHRRTAGL